MADVPKNELLPEIKNIVKNYYQNKPSFEETEQMFNKLLNFNFKELVKIYTKIENKEKTKKRNIFKKIEEFNEEKDEKIDIIRFILIKLIKIKKCPNKIFF